MFNFIDSIFSKIRSFILRTDNNESKQKGIVETLVDEGGHLNGETPTLRESDGKGVLTSLNNKTQTSEDAPKEQTSAEQPVPEDEHTETRIADPETEELMEETVNIRSNDRLKEQTPVEQLESEKEQPNKNPKTPEDKPTEPSSTAESELDEKTNGDNQTPKQLHTETPSAEQPESEREEPAKSPKEPTEHSSTAEPEAELEEVNGDNQTPKQSHAETPSAEEPKPKKEEPTTKSQTQKNRASETNNKSPQQRGSQRDRGNITTSTSPDTVQEPTSKPELICRERPSNRDWEIILSVPEELNVDEVLHDHTPLPGDDGEYSLTRYSGNITVKYKDGSHDDEILLFDEERKRPLIFKLNQKWTGDGRQMDGITQGYFIVIAPSEWTRTGAPPVDPTGSPYPDFHAHYFYASKEDTSDQIGGFKGYSISLTRSKFELIGDTVFDNSDEGELFVGKPPKLNASSDIEWARVGEEKKVGWAENFQPVNKSLTKVINRRQGRFFIRVYRKGETRLCDSESFRYCADLKEIRIDGKPHEEDALLTPSPNRHSPTTLQFLGHDGSTICPKPTSQNPHATVDEGGTVTIAPHPDADDTTWSIGDDAQTTNIRIKLPRIWWRVIQPDDSTQDDWHDTPFIMSRHEFRENSDAELQIKLPPRIRNIQVGFNEEVNLRYPVRREDDETYQVGISLGDFIDHQEIDERLTKEASLNFQFNEYVLTPIRISADPTPAITSFSVEPAMIDKGKEATLQWNTVNTEDSRITIQPEIGSVDSSGSVKVKQDNTTSFTLTLTTLGIDDLTQTITLKVIHPPDNSIAFVKSLKTHYRKGRGFSLRELKAAKITIDEARSLGISIDKRRHSIHKINLNKLKEIKRHAYSKPD